MSETDTCRHVLERFCNGNGLDIGHGCMRPIKEDAICIDNVRRPNASWATHLTWNAFGRLPFDSQTFDYVFSSHCLEDAKDTASVLREWVRLLKVGGNLVLFLPDQQTYEKHCRDNGSEPNAAHVHKFFSLDFVQSKLPNTMRILMRSWPFPGNPYSFALVAQRMS